MARVLVVDDEVQVVSALRRALTRRGFTVSTATSGEAALEMLAEVQPEIVLSDFRMPGMTGAELLATVKQRLPQALRVIVSGYADLQSVAASVNDGEICRFITKPWDDDLLAEKLQGLLRARRALVELHRGIAPVAREAEFIQRERTVELRLVTGAAVTAARAAELICQLTGMAEARQLSVVAGLLERTGGRVSFLAELGGQERLTIELPINEDTVANAAAHLT